MDQKDWQILIALHNEKNITKTAEKLFVSQPSLSYRLKNLEEEIGTNLLFKTKTGIEFTGEGEYLVEYSKDMLKHLQIMKDNINDISGEISGTLKIGSSSNFAQYVLPALLKTFSDKFPKVRFNVTTGWSSDIHKHLNDNNIHVGILRKDYNWQKEKILLNKEPLCIISQEKLDLNKLPEYKQIDYKTDNSLKETINKWWAATYSSPANIEMEVDRLETCKELVKNGLGYAIVPEICLYDDEKLFKEEVISIDNSPVTRESWLMYNSDFQELTIVSKFIEHMKSWGNIDKK